MAKKYAGTVHIRVCVAHWAAAMEVGPQGAAPVAQHLVVGTVLSRLGFTTDLLRIDPVGYSFAAGTFAPNVNPPVWFAGQGDFNQGNIIHSALDRAGSSSNEQEAKNFANEFGADTAKYGEVKGTAMSLAHTVGLDSVLMVPTETQSKFGTFGARPPMKITLTAGEKDSVKNRIIDVVKSMGKAISPAEADTTMEPVYHAAKSQAIKTILFKWKEPYKFDSLQIPIYYDTAANAFRIVDQMETLDGTDAYTLAMKAAAAYDKVLTTAIAKAVDGGVPAWPSDVRPVATASPDLTVDQKKQMDDWWTRSSQLLAEFKAKTYPSQDDAYANYVANGGTKTKADWLLAAPTREAIINSETSSKSLTDRVIDGTGWLADTAVDLLKAGGAGLTDVVKSWGPMGTVGAYTGIKAVNAVSGDGSIPSWLKWSALGLGALLLTR